MGNYFYLRRYGLGFFAGLVLIAFFQNCAGPSAGQQSSVQDLPSTPENYFWIGESVPSGLRSVNYFVSSKPKDMSGFEGYGYLYSEYLSKKCAVCHKPPGGQLPHFGTTSLSYSYDLAKRDFRTGDIAVRITANPHCPECNLDQRGEVYQAVMYWLEHR